MHNLLLISDTHFSGWSKLVYFDREEHKVFFTKEAKSTLASIPKLAAQWKIVHEFKTTTDYYMTTDDPHVSLWMSTSSNNYILAIFLQHPNIALEVLVGLRSYKLEGAQLPELGEWTRIEISHEEEECGKYFISFSVGGKQMGKREVDDYQLRNLRGVKLNTGAMDGMADPPPSQPGFIKGLIALEKQ